MSLAGLYAITDSSLGDHLLERVEQALQGGAQIVQYRDKSNDGNKRLKEAQALNQLCQDYHAPLFINDDVQLAKQVDAAGVHIGKEDGLLADARAVLGKQKIIGVSCYADLALAERMQKQGADYVAFGAVFPSATKPQAPKAALNILAQAKQRLMLPICAIGGITLDNIDQVIHNGADMVAVISELFSNDPQHASNYSYLTALQLSKQFK